MLAQELTLALTSGDHTGRDMLASLEVLALMPDRVFARGGVVILLVLILALIYQLLARSSMPNASALGWLHQRRWPNA